MVSSSSGIGGVGVGVCEIAAVTKMKKDVKNEIVRRVVKSFITLVGTSAVLSQT
jgi:hypothetical protein